MALKESHNVSPILTCTPTHPHSTNTENFLIASGSEFCFCFCFFLSCPWATRDLTEKCVEHKTSKSKGMPGSPFCLCDIFIGSRKCSSQNTDSCRPSSRRPGAHSPSKWQILLFPSHLQWPEGCHLEPCWPLFPSTNSQAARRVLLTQVPLQGAGKVIQSKKIQSKNKP